MGAIYKECAACNFRYASIDDDLCDECYSDYQGTKIAEINERHILCQSVNSDGSLCQNPAKHFIPFEGNVCADHLGNSEPAGAPRAPRKKFRLRNLQLDETGRSAAKGKGRVPMPPPTKVMDDSRTQRTRTRGDAERSALLEETCSTCGGTGRSRDGRSSCSANCDDGYSTE